MEEQAGSVLAGDFQPGRQAGFGFAPQRQGARGEEFGQAVRERGADIDFIGLFHFVFGRSQTVAERAVIGDQEQAAGLAVEPAHTDRPRIPPHPLRRQKIVNQRCLGGIMGAGVTDGLVQHHQQPIRELHRLAINQHRLRSHPLIAALKRLAFPGDPPG